MPKYLYRNGFLLVPSVTIVDTDTKTSKVQQLPPRPLDDGDGVLSTFEANWPQEFAEMEVRFASEQEQMEQIMAQGPPPEVAEGGVPAPTPDDPTLPVNSSLPPVTVTEAETAEPDVSESLNSPADATDS